MFKKIVMWGLAIALGQSGAAKFAFQEKEWNKLNSEKTADLILEVIKYFEDYYVDGKKLSREKLIHRALNGALSADPHSCFFDAEEFQKLCEHTKGEFDGVGMEVTMDPAEHGAIIIVSAIDDTPAAQAGLKAKDRVIAINGTPVTGMTLTQAVDRIRGKAGTAVDLLIKREGVPPFPVLLTRQVIAVKSVKWKVMGDVGYIRISTFDEKVTNLLEKAILDLKKTLGASLKGLVIDLRDNPGGLLDQAISVVNLFVDRGVIVSTKGRKPEYDSVTSAIPGNAIVGDVPAVVMINEGSASASEIVAGALQDHKKALVVGETSFGKGSVQNLIPLSGGRGIKLTVARFYTPLGHAIQGEGIKPDVEVKQMAVVEEKPSFSFRERDLLGSLDTEKALEQGLKDKEGALKEAVEKAAPSQEPQKLPPRPSSQALSKGERAVEDYQLLRALDIVRALHAFYVDKPKVLSPAAKP